MEGREGFLSSSHHQKRGNPRLGGLAFVISLNGGKGEEGALFFRQRKKRGTYYLHGLTFEGPGSREKKKACLLAILSQEGKKRGGWAGFLNPRKGNK